MDTTRSTASNIVGPYEIRYIPTGIVGQWYVVDRRINIHIQVFRTRDEAVAWARRMASGQERAQDGAGRDCG